MDIEEHFIDASAPDLKAAKNNVEPQAIHLSNRTLYNLAKFNRKVSQEHL